MSAKDRGMRAADKMREIVDEILEHYDGVIDPDESDRIEANTQREHDQIVMALDAMHERNDDQLERRNEYLEMENRQLTMKLAKAGAAKELKQKKIVELETELRRLRLSEGLAGDW